MTTAGEAQKRYREEMADLSTALGEGLAGEVAVLSRSNAVDGLVCALWAETVRGREALGTGVALLAIGGFGRRQLFPSSDVDLLVLLDGRVDEAELREGVRAFSQQMWDSGARFSPVTRRVGECERFDPENVEFALALLDERFVCGDRAVHERLRTRALPRLYRDPVAILRRLAAATETRHSKYGNTLFHLEPNVKDCPGGLRDVHVVEWLGRLRAMRDDGQGGPRESAATRDERWRGAEAGFDDREFGEAVAFLTQLRCFLHLEHERDDNVLDWHAQDRAALREIGISPGGSGRVMGAAYWMRVYFRHARNVSRRAQQLLMEAVPPARSGVRLLRRGLRPAISVEAAELGIAVGAGGALTLPAISGDGEAAAGDAHVVLALFAEMARTGAAVESRSEGRISAALSLLSANLEEGPALWRGLRAILLGAYAGHALRAMHALGLLDLLVPEFHGIDALVLRDAYHRYTVDEHTFVLIDTLHGLEGAPSPAAGEWRVRFQQLLRELPHLDLLYLAALLHDTGKGRTTDDHAVESARLAETVLSRLELDGYETAMVMELVRYHLEMSAALRRDIFDEETVRAFAGKVRTPEALRMLTLFTYADLNAVHPDALTPWKAENLWRLHMATAAHLDRSVDDERVGARDGVLARAVAAGVPGRQTGVEQFLAGFPERYVRTRTPEQIRAHFEMTARFEEDAVQLDFRYAPALSEITLVTRDRARLFSNMAGALAAWGMNIVTADAFSNASGTVVDSFRFTDTYRTLELNVSERERFVASVHDVMAGAVEVETLLRGRRRRRGKARLREVATVIGFNDAASSHSTLLEVTAEDAPGLLRTVSLVIAAHRCNIEVALVDTEGEVAIDVFYLTRERRKLRAAEQDALAAALVQAIDEARGL